MLRTTLSTLPTGPPARTDTVKMRRQTYSVTIQTINTMTKILTAPPYPPPHTLLASMLRARLTVMMTKTPGQTGETRLRNLLLLAPMPTASDFRQQRERRTLHEVCMKTQRYIIVRVLYNQNTYTVIQYLRPRSTYRNSLGGTIRYGIRGT